MSAFCIKIVAILIMLIDHITVFLDGWNFIDYNTNQVLRGIGRIAFPIFSFLLVNGWKKSSNRTRYLNNLIIFALISQIPFSLALNTLNTVPFEAEMDFSLYYKFFLSPLILSVPSLIIIPVGYYYFYKDQLLKKNISLILLIIALFITLFNIKFLGLYFTKTNFLNVFYTLSVGLVCMNCFDYIKNTYKSKKWYELFLAIAAAFLSVMFIATRSDYGIEGILLIIALFLLKNHRLYQSLFICLWGIYFSGILSNNWIMAVFTCFSVIFIIAYNGKKGKNIKYIFYWFYPIHLLTLAILNILLHF